MTTTRAGAAPLSLMAAPVISYADRFGFLPLVAVAASGLGVSEHSTETAVTVYFLLYGLAQPLIGAASDRYGRVLVLRWALGGLALADLAAALAPGPGVLIAARAVAGAASGALLPTTVVYLGDTVEFRFRQRAVARVLAAAALGAGAAMALAGLLGRWTSWRLPLLAIAVLAPFVAAGMRDLPEPPRTAGGPGIRQVLHGHPALLALLVFGFFEGAAVLGFFTFFTPALQAHGASSAVAGLVVGVYGGATAVGSWLLGRLPQRLIPQLSLMTGGAAMVAGYLAAAIAQTTWTVLAASALLGISFALFHSTFQAWATQLLPAARGVVTSLFVSSVFTGAAAGSAWAGGLESRHAFGTLFAIAAALAAAVTVAGTAARLRSRPQPMRTDTFRTLTGNPYGTFRDLRSPAQRRGLGSGPLPGPACRRDRGLGHRGRPGPIGYGGPWRQVAVPAMPPAVLRDVHSRRVESSLAEPPGAGRRARPVPRRRRAAPARWSPGTRGTGGTIRAGRPRAAQT